MIDGSFSTDMKLEDPLPVPMNAKGLAELVGALELLPSASASTTTDRSMREEAITVPFLNTSPSTLRLAVPPARLPNLGQLVGAAPGWAGGV